MCEFNIWFNAGTRIKTRRSNRKAPLEVLSLSGNLVAFIIKFTNLFQIVDILLYPALHSLNSNQGWV